MTCGLPNTGPGTRGALLEGNVLTPQSYQSFVNVALKLKRDAGGAYHKEGFRKIFTVRETLDKLC
jgi:hypothetical protein